MVVSEMAGARGAEGAEGGEKSRGGDTARPPTRAAAPSSSSACVTTTVASTFFHRQTVANTSRISPSFGIAPNFQPNVNLSHRTAGEVTVGLSGDGASAVNTAPARCNVTNEILCAGVEGAGRGARARADQMGTRRGHP